MSNSLINMKLIEDIVDNETALNESQIDNETDKNTTLDESIYTGLNNDADIGTPNVKLDKEEKHDDVVMTVHKFNGNIEDLEEKIDNDYNSIQESITDAFYDATRNLMLAEAQLETISIDVINKQCKILTESTLGSNKYIDDINTLIESSGDSLLQKIITAITNFITWIKERLRAIGIDISIHFVDYEKYANSEGEDLIKKANEYGTQVQVSAHKWNTDLLFEPVNFSYIQEIADRYVAPTDSKDKMKEIESEIASKYNGTNGYVTLKDDVYSHALALAIGGSGDDRIMSDKNLAKAAFIAKITNKEKTVNMNNERTGKYLKKLKTVKNDTQKSITVMRQSFVNPAFNRLLKDAQREANSRSDKTDSTKYKYYRLRFEVLSAVQNACDDIYKIKVQLMVQYAREMYNSLKALKSYKNTSTNESIDSNTMEYVGYTLHE